MYNFGLFSEPGQTFVFPFLLCLAVLSFVEWSVFKGVSPEFYFQKKKTLKILWETISGSYMLLWAMALHLDYLKLNYKGTYIVWILVTVLLLKTTVLCIFENLGTEKLQIIAHLCKLENWLGFPVTGACFKNKSALTRGLLLKWSCLHADLSAWLAW